MTDLRPREWSKRKFADPAEVLKNLRRLEIGLQVTGSVDADELQRMGRLKTTRELRDAALFAFGMGQALGVKVLMSPGETSDADLITATPLGGETIYVPVQLKELVSEDINATATLDALLSRAKGRPPSDTVLAIHLNRRARVDLSSLQAARVPFAELWYFWCASPDQVQWKLYGDLKGTPQLHSFEYPAL